MKGTIIRSTGSWYEILTEDKSIFKGRLRGKFKIKDLKVTNPIAVGDIVIFEIENGSERTAFIKEILPRENYIIRKSVHKSAHGHLIASNIDQTLLITTLKQPKTSTGFIDRFLVSAEAFRIPAVILFNKLDIYEEDDIHWMNYLIKCYERLGYKCFPTSIINGEGLDQVKDYLKGKKTVISGHSGVGKSSLLNALSPTLVIKTAEISEFANKGVHTTTFAEMHELWDDTYIIDTPGIKELGLFDISQEELSHYFPEMRDLLGQCKFHNCKHYNEPKCAVIQSVKDGNITEMRYVSYISMLLDEDTHR